MQRESIYVHVAFVLFDNVQYTEGTAGHMCVKYGIVILQSRLQRESIYVYVALVLSD